MVDLTNVDLLAIQSRYMQADVTTQALCAALTPLIRELAQQCDLVILYPRINELQGAILDAVAWGLHVDAYDALAADDEKRRMILNSYQVHKFKGTVFAVQRIVEGVFGDDGEVEEWFDYGGDPYHFKVKVLCSARGISAADQTRAINLINAGKNLRSELDGLQLVLVEEAAQKIAAAATISEEIRVYPKED